MFAGIRFTIDLTKPVDSRVTEVLVLNYGTSAFSAIQQEKDYQVVTFDFLVDGGDGYDYLKNRHRNRLDGTYKFVHKMCCILIVNNMIYII